jgi:hypothetical protein
VGTVTTQEEKRSDFWSSLSAALAVLARQSGYSIRESPLPELREAAREWDGHAPGAGKATV